MYILEELEGFKLCDPKNIEQFFSILKTFLNIIRYVVPIGLAIMTTVSILKKTINPDDKDGQKKIISRIIAAVIVFFSPILVRFVVKIVDVGLDNSTAKGEMSSSCISTWEYAKPIDIFGGGN